MFRSRRLLFDTSVLIPLIRGEAYEALFQRSLWGGRARMSSVVMQEPYAGAHGVADKKSLDGINRSFESRGYVVTPGHDDWIGAGRLTARTPSPALSRVSLYGVNSLFLRQPHA